MLQDAGVCVVTYWLLRPVRPLCVCTSTCAMKEKTHQGKSSSCSLPVR